jgi:crotonobetainyl-CoA:carnitine CoA-transferase CaiB-like acyl-CoA transferase
LVRWADAMVWTPGSRWTERTELGPSALRELAPQALVVALTPFGLEGPWAGRAATEFTLQAWSGGPTLRGVPGRPPLCMGGQTGWWVAGMFAAIGAVSARQRWVKTGVGELLDVSVLESLMWTQTTYPVTWRSIPGNSGWISAR